MNIDKWRKPILIPLTVWLTFKVIAFLFGYTPWPDITQLALFGTTFPFISAFGFGLWIGSSSREKFSLSGAVRNAFIVAFLIGFVEMLLTIMLVNTSPSFVSYAISVYPRLQQGIDADIPLLNLVISTWLGGLFVIMPASAAAYSLVEKDKKRR
jgi:hypothetical protein